MKRVHLFLILLVSLLWGTTPARALDLPTGVLKTGNEVTSLETGKWYFLYNHYTKRYIKEDGSNGLKQATSPNGLYAGTNAGYLVTLEETSTAGKYFIRTGLGNYIKGPSTDARGTGAKPLSSWGLTITTITGYPGHFILQGTSYYLTAPSDYSDPKGGSANTANSIGDWAFVEVETGDVSELSGRDLYSYQMDRKGLMRLKNKRYSNYYLTSAAAGSAKGATKAATGLTQVWILEKGDGTYTLRNAATGQYLQKSFSAPADETYGLYIQYSPNNSDTEAYINISSKSDFSGQNCLNLGGDYSLYSWSYSGDSGSDWAIEMADDIDENKVCENLCTVKGYVGTLTEGEYYRLISSAYNRVATETNSQVTAMAADDDNFCQYWTAKKSGNGYLLQNVMTQKYIQPQRTRSSTFFTSGATTALYPSLTNYKWEYKWVIANEYEGTEGMHTAESLSYNVVNWDTDATASTWYIQKVTLSDEQIAEARASYTAYAEVKDNLPTYQGHLDALFQDKACTTLKDEIQALSDSELEANTDFAALNANMKAMVLKIKNNTWQQYANTSTGYSAGYEKFFRIADYKVYSNYSEIGNSSNMAFSYSHGKLSGPTGIVAGANDLLFIYVDDEPSSDCTLQLEQVLATKTPGNNRTGSVTSLHQGLNVVMPSRPVMLYIFYQLNDTKKYLADYHDMKIHIEGGKLNGYWDATRGMTNDDWALLQQDLLTSPMLNLKTEHLVFQMDAASVKSAEPTNMEGLMHIWDNIPAYEESFMGLEEFDGRYRNVWNCFTLYGGDSYMYATTYGTYYQEYTLANIMNYYNMTHQGAGNEGGAIWGPSHEMGHNHQQVINVVGTTESSNNIWSNINMFEQGISVTRGAGFSENMAQFAAGNPWNTRDVWISTRMFFQLYLYFHVMDHDDQFLPKLFKAMRKNPITKTSGWDSTTEYSYTENDETKTGTGAFITYGKYDYLHLAKTICDVAQADMSELFEVYGMFVPVDKLHVYDYSHYLVTTTQEDIDEAKAYMHQYSKKMGNMMFIDDRIVQKKANPSPLFDGVPSCTYKVTCSNTTGQKVGTAGNYGDYEVFDSNTAFKSNSDYYTLATDGTIRFVGKGMVGHKIYNKASGKLLYATNATSVKLPTDIAALGYENLVVVGADANMQDAPCPYFNRSTSPTYASNVYFGNDTDVQTWYANASIDLGDYLPENAIGVVQTNNAPDCVTSVPNIINKDNTATSIVLNGDLPAYIPVETTAAKVTFSKAFDGYAALDLPFNVTSSDIAGLKTATYNDNSVVVTDAESVEAGQPVVVSNGINVTANNATVKSGSYQAQEYITTLGTDGESLVDLEVASPFIYKLDEATGIISVESSESEVESSNCFDLSGRRIHRVTKPGLYIIGNKKMIIK